MKKFFATIITIFIAFSFVSAQEAPKEVIKENEADVKEATKELPKEVTKQSEVKETVKEVTKELPKDTSKNEKKSKSAGEYIADLSSKDENTVIEAEDQLGKEGEKAAVPALMKLLKNDERAKVRIFASVALGMIKDESCVDVLNEALLNDQNSDVRYSAILAISRIGSMKSIDTLKTAKEKESDPYIKDYIEKIEAKFKKK
jgi:HEAT repeat protein